MQTLQRSRADRGELAARVKFDPDEPRDESGKWTDGGGGDGGGSGSAPATPASEKPAASSGGKGKGKVSQVADFNKKGIRLDHDTTINPAKAEKFLARWNDRVQEAPEDFKNEFLGGLPGTMHIDYNESTDKLEVSGRLQEGGSEIGEYQRSLDLKNNSAYSAYFVLKKGERGSGVGKTLLKSNVAMYQKLGFDKVTVSANIDVGGYAWAKYGYVPTASSWRSLSSEIRDKLNNDGDRARHTASGSGYTPESWDQIGDHDQSQIENAWMRATHDEFVDSEVQNWRDSGQALEDAKTNLAENDVRDESWAKAALEEWRNGRDDDGAGIPFTNEQILEAVSLDYSSRRGDGSDDPDITIDEDKLKDETQPSLPGLEAPPLSETTQQEITDALTKGFNDEAESNAQDADPPSYISDSVSEYQDEYWSSMDDEQKYEWAERNSELPEYPLEDDEEDRPEPVEVTDEQQNALMKLAQSSDPKALWAIADSEKGKQLLLGTSWSGVLDLKDKQTMDRFHAYVGK
jgi:hypothetical protein